MTSRELLVPRLTNERPPLQRLRTTLLPCPPRLVGPSAMRAQPPPTLKQPGPRGQVPLPTSCNDPRAAGPPPSWDQPPLPGRPPPRLTRLALDDTTFTDSSSRTALGSTHAASAPTFARTSRTRHVFASIPLAPDRRGLRPLRSRPSASVPHLSRPLHTSRGHTSLSLPAIDGGALSAPATAPRRTGRASSRGSARAPRPPSARCSPARSYSGRWG